MTKMLGRIIGEDIRLQWSYGSNLPTVQADEGMMEQVLMNLAVNARDAMAKGGQLIIGTDRVATNATYVQNNPEARAGEFVRLSVQDTGCGMTPAVKARIFEPFFTTKGVGKGTGLGLATVFGIVKQSGGFIWVYSEPGRGTSFKVYLPRVDEPPGPAAGPVDKAEPRRGTETVLVVEDAASSRMATG